MPTEDREDEDLSLLGGRIRFAMRWRGMNAATLAARVKVPPSAISRAYKRMDPASVKRIAEALNARLEWLSDPEDGGQWWTEGHAPPPVRPEVVDGRRKAFRGQGAGVLASALERFPFDEALDYFRGRALAAVTLVRQGWPEGRVMADINRACLRFQEPPGTTDEQIAAGIASTLTRMKGEKKGTLRAVKLAGPDPGLPSKKAKR